MKPAIEVGDVVRVHFNGPGYTLASRATVLHTPAAIGDSWQFEDIENGAIHYVSEGCTITKIVDRPPRTGPKPF